MLVKLDARTIITIVAFLQIMSIHYTLVYCHLFNSFFCRIRLLSCFCTFSISHCHQYLLLDVRCQRLWIWGLVDNSYYNSSSDCCMFVSSVEILVHDLSGTRVVLFSDYFLLIQWWSPRDRCLGSRQFRDRFLNVSARDFSLVLKKKFQLYHCF